MQVDGLADIQRQIEDGYNELPSAKPRNVLAIVVEVLREPMLLLLIAASGVYLLIGDRTEGLMLMVAVIEHYLLPTLYPHALTRESKSRGWRRCGC